MPFRIRSIPLPGTVRRAVPAVLCTAGLTGGWLAAAAPADAAPHPAPATGVMHSVARMPSAKQILAYWTPARLRAAKTADVVVARTKPDVRPANARQPGRAGQVAGGLPGGHPLAVPQRGTGITPAAFGYPFPYDSYTPPAGLWRTFPYSVNGKLFFVNNGQGFVCSATAVASANGTANENEIWTAGHCLVNTTGNNQKVDTSALFIPAYNGNVSNFDPFGEFVWNGGWATASAWYYHSDLTEDEAAMTVGVSTTTHRTLGQAVGWDGFAWNWPVNEQFVAFGYPQASPYNGLNLVKDLAATAGQDGAISGANPVKPIAIGNPMTGGSSGGAWDILWTDGGPGYINGHNDYKYTSQPLAMYSPYQDTLSNMVRCFGRSSC
jgi:hypothetical protein